MAIKVSFNFFLSFTSVTSAIQNNAETSLFIKPYKYINNKMSKKSTTIKEAQNKLSHNNVSDIIIYYN